MKTVKYTLIALLALLVTVGCKDDQTTPQPGGSNGFTVTASIDGTLNAAWKAGDEIKIVCADEIYTFITAEGGSSATFTSKDDNLSAAMIGNNPVSAFANCSSMYGTFIIQTEQRVNDGVNAARVPMFAYTMNTPQANNLSLNFKPLASLLELEVEPYDITVQRLTMAPAAGATISGGAMAGGYTIDAAKSVVNLTNPLNSITLEFVGGINLSQGITLRIPIGWFAIEGGLDLTFYQGARSFVNTIWAEDGLVKTFADGTGFKQARLMRELFEFDASAFPRDYYVKADASSAAKGLTWDAPTSLSSAIANAAAGSTIHIAEGTYNPSGILTGRDASDQTKTFEISRNVTIIGGYPANAAPGAVSNPATYKTILDGNGKSFHTVVVSAPKSAGEKVSITGITIKGGKNSSGDLTATGINSIALYDSYGAGIALVGTKVELANCIISENEGDFAAGLWSSNSEVVITGCTFSQNIASGNGGGALFTNNSDLTMQSTAFTNNRAAIAGGLYLHSPSGQGLSAAISGTTLSGNTSSTTASAIFINDDSGNNALQSSFTDCTITDNTSTATADMGGTIKTINARVLFTNCIISNNGVSNNGMMCVTTSGSGTSNATFDGCYFTGNITSGAAVAAGIYFYTGGGALDAFIINSTFADNTSVGRGGAIYARSGVASGPVNLTCVNSTFSANTAGSNGAAVAMYGSATMLVNTTLISCTLTGNISTHATNNGTITLETAGNTFKAYNTILSGNTVDVRVANGTASYYNTFIGSQFYDPAGAAQATTPVFTASTMLAALADNGGSTLTHKLIGNASTNPAFGNGMTATALKAMATADISADILGADQTGTARTDTDRIVGACIK